MTPGMRLYLIRHPRPHDIAGLCYGRKDVPVDADALARAANSVREQILEPELGHAHVFCSPSARCVLLARSLAAPREPTPANDLLELNFGAWEGLAWNAIPRQQLDAWANDIWRYCPGGAESAALVAARWLRWSGWLRDSGIGTALAVTHAGLIRVALRCSGLLNASTFLHTAIDYGSVHRVELEHRGSRA
jgi:alpha-ribazole phosphatase